MMTPEFPNRLARIASILTLLGSLIWTQFPINFEQYNAASVVAFVAALVTWIAIEISDYQGDKNINDNILCKDVERINKIIEFIDGRQYYILKNHGIENYVNSHDYDRIQDLLSFNEQDVFKFNNKDIQLHYDSFCKLAEQFIHDYYRLYTNDGTGRCTWRPRGDAYVSEEVYGRVMDKVAALNAQTKLLANKWETLIAVAQGELKGASKSINQYPAKIGA